MRKINGRTISQFMMAFLALIFVALGLAYPQLNAIGDYMNIPPPPPITPPPPPVHIPQTPPPPFTPPIVVPTDVTSNIPNTNMIATPSNSLGINPISPGKMPSVDSLKGSTDFLLVKSKPGTDFAKISPYAVNVKQGTVLVGVRKPSETGMITTEIGNIAIFSNAAGADAIVTFKDGVMRVMNLDGLGENIRLVLIGPQFNELGSKTFTLKPGHELIASTSQLSRKDMRPDDGIGRRAFQLIGNKHVAIDQFSVESVLKGSDLIASMNQTDSGSKEKRILADMSKMAAVLNQVNGSGGYEGAAKP